MLDDMDNPVAEMREVMRDVVRELRGGGVAGAGEAEQVRQVGQAELEIWPAALHDFLGETEQVDPQFVAVIVWYARQDYFFEDYHQVFSAQSTYQAHQAL